MKKVVYYFAIFTFIFTSCTPLEDVHEDIDAQESFISGEANYTLTNDDYTEDVEDGGLGFRFPNFSSLDEVKAELPAFLTSKYPAWGKESLVTVNYKLYAPKRTEKSLIVYKVTSDDYAAGGHSFGNFSRPEHITDFLDTKYPSPADRVLVSLTYKYYSGSVATLNNGFLFVNNEWQMVTGFSDDEYEAMGEGFSNFSSEEEALTKTPIFLLDKFKFDAKEKGNIEAIMYKLYVTDVDDVDGDGRIDDRTAYSYVTYFVFDGSSWLPYENTVEESIKFGHDGITWVPDNTIKYTLTAADYDLVDNGFYDNFDVREGKGEAEESVRLEKINTILLNNFPSDEEGQKYVVSYNIYNGSDAVWSLAVVKIGAKYVKQ